MLSIQLKSVERLHKVAQAAKGIPGRGITQPSLYLSADYSTSLMAVSLVNIVYCCRLLF